MPFNGRQEDYISFGSAHTPVNPGKFQYEEAKLASEGITNFPLRKGKAVFEGGYGIKVARWWLIHPNFQYAVNPEACSCTHAPNPQVFGVQTVVTF